MNPKTTAKLIRARARELYKGMRAGGRHGTKKGAKGYTRKVKHPGRAV